MKRHLMGIMLTVGVAIAALGCQAPTTATNAAYNELPPANSRLIEPLLPQSIRHFALSPDRKRVAYSEDGQSPSRLYIATFGEDARQIAELRPDIEQLQWTADGSALLYVDTVDRVIPGQYVDWDLPRTEILEYRLMRLPIEGGEPQPVFSFERQPLFQASPSADQVFFSVVSEGNGGFFGPIHRLDLDTSKQEVVFEAKAVDSFDLSPDGIRLLVSEHDPQAGQGMIVKVLDLAAGETSAIAPRPSGPLNWAADGKSILAFSPENEDGALTMQRFPLTGEAPETKQFPSLAKAQLGKLQLEMLSPDGRRLVAYSGNTNVIINLETGDVKTLDSFGYIRCWLDDRTVMGTYQGGQYAVDVAE